MTSPTRIARGLTGATSLLTGLVLLSSGRTLAAQEVNADPRWQAWLGCWEAVESDVDLVATINGVKKPRICVIPTAGTSAVDITTLVGDSVALRQHMEVTGAQRQMTRDGCTGWERAQWSQNGQRVYLRSSYSCPGGLTRTSNGVMALSAEGEWLDVQGIVAGTTVGVRVARYRDVTDVASLPVEIAAALRGRERAVTDARIIARAPLVTADVVEASRFLDPGVVQTWLAERGEGFALDANRLMELEKAGVAPNVIDVMVALSYPRVFALDRSRVGGPNDTRTTDEVGGSGRTVYVYGWDPFYSDYRYSRYGSRYGRYGYGYDGWYYGTSPVVIVRPPSGSADDDRHGRVVKGRGYTPGRGSTRGGDKATATGSKESGSSGGSASSGSSGGSSSKSPSSGTGRTAKPRRPPG